MSDPEPRRTGGPKGSGLTPELIEYEKNTLGLTQKQIAEKYQVSSQAVSAMKRYGGRKFSTTPREDAREKYPWNVPDAQQDCWIDKRLRDHGEYQTTGGKGMTRDKLRRLRWFYDQLERDEVVVEYRPDNPPNEHAAHGGYRFVPREGSDGELIVRVDEDTRMDRAGRQIWTMPKVLPKA
jgi:hypothetical protein